MPSWVFQNLRLFLKNLSERRLLLRERFQLVCMLYAEGEKTCWSSKEEKRDRSLKCPQLSKQVCWKSKSFRKSSHPWLWGSVVSRLTQPEPSCLCLHSFHLSGAPAVKDTLLRRVETSLTCWTLVSYSHPYKLQGRNKWNGCTSNPSRWNHCLSFCCSLHMNN